MTKLKPGQSIKRLVRVAGVDQPVCADITADGIYLWVSGSRKKVFASWLHVAGASHTPADVPSYLYGDPLEMLRHQSARST